MSPDASLAQAEAALRSEKRKHEEERTVTARIERAFEENDLARRFREAFGGRQ